MIDNLYELSNTIAAVVNRILEKGAVTSTTGQCTITHNDVADLIEYEDYLRYFDFIAGELESREEVIDLDVYEHRFDIVLDLSWCKNYEPLPDETFSFGEKTLYPKPSMAHLAEIGQKTIQHLAQEGHLQQIAPEELGIWAADLDFARSLAGLSTEQTDLSSSIPSRVTNLCYEDLIILSAMQKEGCQHGDHDDLSPPAFQLCVNTFGQMDDRLLAHFPEGRAAFAQLFRQPSSTLRCGALISGRPALLLSHEVPSHFEDIHLTHAMTAMMAGALRSIFPDSLAQITYGRCTGDGYKNEIIAILPAEADPRDIKTFDVKLAKTLKDLPLIQNPNWVQRQYQALLSEVESNISHIPVSPWTKALPSECAIHACERLGGAIGRYSKPLHKVLQSGNQEDLSHCISDFQLDMTQSHTLRAAHTQEGILSADSYLRAPIRLYTSHDPPESFELSRGQLIQALERMGYEADYTPLDFMLSYSDEAAREVHSILPDLPKHSLEHTMASAKQRREGQSPATEPTMNQTTLRSN